MLCDVRWHEIGWDDIIETLMWCDVVSMRYDQVRWCDMRLCYATNVIWYQEYGGWSQDLMRHDMVWPKLIIYDFMHTAWWLQAIQKILVNHVFTSARQRNRPLPKAHSVRWVRTREKTAWSDSQSTNRLNYWGIKNVYCKTTNKLSCHVKWNERI